MKKKNSFFLAGLLALALLASCKKDNNNQDLTGTDLMRANIEQPTSNGSRTHIEVNGNEGLVRWNEGDQFLVVDANGDAYTFTLNSGQSGETEPMFRSPGSDNLTSPFAAVYPATNSITGTTATITLPATQPYAEGSFANGTNVMVGYQAGSEREVEFKNVLGGLCFPIVGNGLRVTRVVVTSATDEALWGVCETSISTNGDDPVSTVSNTEVGKNTITLDCSANGGLILNGTPVDFYVMVPAGTLESGFTVRAYNDNDMIYEKTVDWSAAPVANFIPRNMIRKVDHDLSIAVTVTTVSPTFITKNSAKAIGKVSHQLPEDDCQTGMLYANVDELQGDVNTLVIDNASVHVLTTTTPSTSYEFDLTGLVEDKVYYVRAFAKTEGGDYVYGDAVPFATRYDYYSSTNRGKSRYTFSVGANKSVYFSMGNLQYIGSASTPYWKFADNQFDFFCINGQENTDANVDRDYFGWGTSGYHDSNDPYNVNYYPYCIGMEEVNPENNMYGYGPSINMTDPNLTGTSANYDWGVYNAISNGGNQPNQWRTLQGSDIGDNTCEWDYVFSSRSGNRYVNVQLYVQGNANNDVIDLNNGAKACGRIINGVMLFPDNFSWPNLIDNNMLVSMNAPSQWGTNMLSEAQWSLFEQAGAVFFPAAGLRQGGYIYLYDLGVFYWSATYYGYEIGGAQVTPERRSWHAYYLECGSTTLYTRVPNFRYDGMPVRLVRDVN